MNSLNTLLGEIQCQITELSALLRTVEQETTLETEESLGEVRQLLQSVCDDVFPELNESIKMLARSFQLKRREPTPLPEQ